MAIESIYVEAFLDSVLKADTTLVGATALGSASKIYRNRAKQGDVPPYLIYNLQAPNDYTSLNKDRLFSEYLYQVRVVGEVKGMDLQLASRVRIAAHRMDDVLDGIRRQSFTVESVTHSFNVWRESELPVREEAGNTADVFFRNYGGLYRVQIFN